MNEEERRSKVCPICGKDLPLDEFYIRKDGSPGSYCRECSAAWKRQWYKKKKKKPDGIFLHSGFGRLMEHKGMTLRIFWSANMIAALRRHFPTTRNEELAGMLGVSRRTVIRKARELGLEKDPDFLHSVWDENRMMAWSVGKKRQAGWFKKGHTPWNKGMNQSDSI